VDVVFNPEHSSHTRRTLGYTRINGVRARIQTGIIDWTEIGKKIRPDVDLCDVTVMLTDELIRDCSRLV